MEFELACLAAIEFAILIYVSISLGTIKAQLKIIEKKYKWGGVILNNE